MYDRDSVVVTEPSLGLFCSKLGNFNLQPRTLDVEELHLIYIYIYIYIMYIYYIYVCIRYIHTIPCHTIPYHSIALHYITLHYLTRHYITLHTYTYIHTLPDITLHCIALHIALHYMLCLKACLELLTQCKIFVYLEESILVYTSHLAYTRMCRDIRTHSKNWKRRRYATSRNIILAARDCPKQMSLNKAWSVWGIQEKWNRINLPKTICRCSVCFHIPSTKSTRHLQDIYRSEDCLEFLNLISVDIVSLKDV